MFRNKIRRIKESWGLHLKYWFFNKFGKKILDQRHLGGYNVASRRGWLFYGTEFWYDEDYE